MQTVVAGFDRSLFERLAPPFPKVRVLRFDGSRPGDSVEVELDFLFFKFLWKSKITENETQGTTTYFVDEGVAPHLPFGLKKWRHVHRFRALPDGGTSIEDDMEFTSGLYLGDLFLRFGFWLQIGLWRKPIYRNFFRKKSN